MGDIVKHLLYETVFSKSALPSGPRIGIICGARMYWLTYFLRLFNCWALHLLTFALPTFIHRGMKAFNSR